MKDENRTEDYFATLLPWYASGKLSPEETAELDAALRDDPHLRALLALANEDAQATVDVYERLGAPSPAAWDRIAAVAAAEPRKAPILSRLAGFFGLGAEPNRPRLAWTGAAAALIIVLQAGALVSLLPAEVARKDASPSYATASAPALVGTTAQIVFAADARLDQIGAFLVNHHATIVDGPRSGFYKVRFGDKSLDKPATEALLADLRSNPLVKMALPAGN